jgi:uncharacterized membrane protein YbhN (UPF0104 family)
MTQDSPPSTLSSLKLSSTDLGAERESRANRTDLDTSADLELDDAEFQAQEQAVQSESLGKRFFEPKTIISFLFAIVVMVFTIRRLNISPSEVWSYVKEVNLAYFGLAAVAFYGSFIVRAFRWRGMLSRSGINAEKGYDVPGIPGLLKILLLSWFANCVVPAKLGDAFRGFLLKERTKASFGVSMGTILAERLMDLVVLVFILLASGLIVFGTHIPRQAEWAFLLGAGTVTVGVVGVIVLWFARESVERLLPERFTLHFQKISTGIFHSLRNPTPLVGLSIIVWLLDGVRIFLVAKSLGINLAVAEGLLVSLSSALVTIIPFTPGGLGLVDSFMIWILGQVDVLENAAAAVTFVDRLISYWSLILIGLPLYLLHLRSSIGKQEG